MKNLIPQLWHMQAARHVLADFVLTIIKHDNDNCQKYKADPGH